MNSILLQVVCILVAATVTDAWYSTDCHDNSDKCAEWEKHGYCRNDNNRDEVKKYHCSKTCRYCINPNDLEGSARPYVAVEGSGHDRGERRGRRHRYGGRRGRKDRYDDDYDYDGKDYGHERKYIQEQRSKFEQGSFKHQGSGFGRGFFEVKGNKNAKIRIAERKVSNKDCGNDNKNYGSSPKQ